MRISPIRFNINRCDTSASAKDFTPVSTRYNALHDMEFDIIADKIRSENLKNQMNLQLARLKRNINNFINGND